MSRKRSSQEGFRRSLGDNLFFCTPWWNIGTRRFGRRSRRCVVAKATQADGKNNSRTRCPLCRTLRSRNSPDFASCAQWAVFARSIHHRTLLSGALRHSIRYMTPLLAQSSVLDSLTTHLPQHVKLPLRGAFPNTRSHGSELGLVSPPHHLFPSTPFRTRLVKTVAAAFYGSYVSYLRIVDLAMDFYPGRKYLKLDLNLATEGSSADSSQTSGTRTTLRGSVGSRDDC
ncbi:hypothetical protein BXZ70DRAFT_929438 [Cristinia sonorae]|uniref:Uncharacterized protein n=1 Tax=Cristinia sonorae TaxID=1940300 RepID=A0A8K0USZ6_9AGAR|nr:hypothetical protein BXZ70DRAFT_929438 [Cristinia sonorae]